MKVSETLIAVKISAAIFSSLCSLFIIVMYILHKQLRTFSFRLVYWLSVSDLLFSIQAIFYLFDVTKRKWLCLLQSYMTEYFLLCSLFWTTIIAFVQYLVAVRSKKNIELQFKKLFIFAFCAPIFITIIPQFWNMYGVTSVYCWIKYEDENTQTFHIFELLIWYAPLLLSICFNLIIYFQLNRTFSKVLDKVQRNARYDLIRYLWIYPVIQAACWSVMIIWRISQLFGMNDCDSTCPYLGLSIAYLQGFFNAVAYGYNQSVREVLFGPKDQLNSSLEIESQVSSERTSNNIIASSSIDIGEPFKKSNEISLISHSQHSTIRSTF